jgi:hypothetical protein
MGENWLAPQPTASSASATGSQLRDLIGAMHAS